MGDTYEKLNTKEGWINNIGDLLRTEGYKIRVKADCVLEITGQQVRLPLNIELKKGWNIISFPYLVEMNALDVIQPLIDAGVLIKAQDETGNSVEYWDSLNDWINGIGNFKPGKGYMVQVNADFVLPVQDYNFKSAAQMGAVPETVYFSPAFEGNGSNHMNINIINLDETGLKVGDEIAAFDGEICVGAVKLTQTHFNNNAVSVIASLADEDMTNGFSEGDSIKLLVWNEQTNEESQVTLSTAEGNFSYQKKASVFGKLSSLDEKQGLNLFEINMYPNPTTDKINIRFSNLPEIGCRIILIDLTGKQLQSKEVQSTYEFFDLQSYSPGVYFVKTVIGGQYQVEKFIKN